VRSTGTILLGTAAGAIVISVMVVLGASPALADEFALGILIEAGHDESDGVEFMRGFQLAIDQSPDVSHPQGVEGGDHLGSMDVVIVLADDGDSADRILNDARDMVANEGLPIIVADVSMEALEFIVGPVTDSDTMLIAATGLDPADFGELMYFFAAGEGPSTIALLDDRQPGFREAFVIAYGSEASDAAVQGYLAGRVVDSAVEATDRDPSDVQKLAAALRVATGSPASAATAEASSRLPGLLVVGLVAAAGIAGVSILLRRGT
jgi:hypothetical protein